MTVIYGAASASTAYNMGDAAPSNAIDGNSGTHWITNGSSLPQWWAVETNPVAVTSYGVTCDYIPRSINAWLLQGSTADSSTDVPAGTTTTGSSQYGGGGAWAWINATDDNWVTSWTSASNIPQWLCVQLATAAIYTEYCIGSYPDGRSPTGWTFQGSNDGSTWTTLDTQTGISGWATSTFKNFTFSNSTAYLYYRVNISAGGDGSYVSISRFRLGDPPPPWVTLDSRSGYTWTTGETKIFTLVNTTPYTIYRLYITANAGDAYAQIAEITMTNTQQPDPPSRAKIVASLAAQRASRW
jgi:hypothetical protein